MIKKTASQSSLPARLFDAGAVKIDTKGGFKLKIHETQPQAPLSPIYLNLRTPDNPKPGPLTPQLVGEIGAALWCLARRQYLPFDGVAGLPNAGTPLAYAFAVAAKRCGMEIPLLVLGKETSAEKRAIAGIKSDGGLPPVRGRDTTTVLVVDDLITAGGSKDEGIGVLTKAGYRVRDVVVLVDREQGGADYLRKRGFGLHAAFTLAGIVDELARAGEKRISHGDGKTVLEYLARERYAGTQRAA